MTFVICFEKVLVFMLSGLIIFGKLLAIGNRYWYQGRPKRAVPPIEDPLLLMSATALAAGIRTRKIRSQDVIKSYIQRIEQVQPYICALAENQFVEAEIEARGVDNFISSTTMTPAEIEQDRPLLGVPFSVKMIFFVKGLYFNGESLEQKDLKAEKDSAVVTKMKTAGAILLMTTTLTEAKGTINKERYGTTSNPYDCSRTAAATSTGEAAMISAGGSVIGIGNDLFGSLRMPALFTGIFAHKSSRGLIPTKDMFLKLNANILDYACSGPMCRYAEDLSLCTKILAAKQEAIKDFDLPVNFHGLKVYYMLQTPDVFANHPTDSGIVDAISKTIHYFEKTHGIKAKKLELRYMKYAMLIYMSRLSPDLKSSVRSAHIVLKKNNDSLLKKILFGKSEITLMTLILGRFFSSQLYKHPLFTQRYQMLYEKLRNELAAILDTSSVLICPTLPRTSQHHNENMLWLTWKSGIACVCNMLGLPSTQCPAGLGQDGMPVGFQIVGCVGNDRVTIACAREVEKCFGGWVPPGQQRPS